MSKTKVDFENLKIEILDERFYQSQNNKEIYYPGATTILNDYPKDNLIDWFMKVGLQAKELSRRAMERGSRVHGAIEQFCKGELITCIDDEGGLKGFQGFDEWKLVCRFYEWYQRYTPEIIATELVLVSDNLEFGGTLDLICRISQNYELKETNKWDNSEPDYILQGNGFETWLIDYKTGGSYQEHKLQLAAYKKLAEDCGLQIDRVGIFYLEALTRTDKWMQGKGWRVEEITDKIDEYWEIFKHNHEIWKFRNPNYKPKNLIYPMELTINNNHDDRENNNIQEQSKD